MSRGRLDELRPGRLFSQLITSAQVAQSVEQWTENPRVGGSIPPLGTSEAAYYTRLAAKGKDPKNYFAVLWEGNSMSGTKIVKRYANRKLYDTDRSCYVTLEDISAMIKAGDEVRVVDNKSGEDLTSVTLAQIIFENEKRSNFMPLSLLRGLIQDGGDAINSFAQKQVEGVQQKALEVKETAHKFRTEIEGRLKGRADEAGSDTSVEPKPRILSDLVAASHKAFDELQKGVEMRVRGPVGAFTRYATLGSEMNEIRERMGELERRLENIPQ